MGAYCGPDWTRVRRSTADGVFVILLLTIVLCVPTITIITCYVQIYHEVRTSSNIITFYWWKMDLIHLKLQVDVILIVLGGKVSHWLIQVTWPVEGTWYHGWHLVKPTANRFRFRYRSTTRPRCSIYRATNAEPSKWSANWHGHSSAKFVSLFWYSPLLGIKTSSIHCNKVCHCIPSLLEKVR